MDNRKTLSYTGNWCNQKFEIQTIPHFKFFKENKEIVTFSGANKQNITEAINKLLE